MAILPQPLLIFQIDDADEHLLNAEVADVDEVFNDCEADFERVIDNRQLKVNLTFFELEDYAFVGQQPEFFHRC